MRVFAKAVRGVPVLGAVVLLFVAINHLMALQPDSTTLTVIPTTQVSGVIDQDTTWTLAGSPYEVPDFAQIVVASGAELTLEPGVQVLLGESAIFRVAGSINAAGTEGQPIRMTGTQATPGWWSGLIIWGESANQPAHANLSHVIIEYGGREAAPTLSGFANLETGQAEVEARYIELRHSAGDGILTHANTSLVMEDALLEDNAGAAARVRSFSTQPVLARLTAAQNGQNVVMMGGDVNLTGNDVWEYTGVPYGLSSVMKITTGSTLTVEPGVVVLVNANQGIEVSGALLADGTQDRPIVFTGVQKSPGSWQGIGLSGPAGNPPFLRLSHATVEYGGLAAGNDANIRVDSGSVNISDSTIRGSLGHGLYFWGSQSGSVVENSHIVDNAGYGILGAGGGSGQVLLAANNWWGSPSGPLVDGACNPGGQGSRLGKGVIFQPFLTSANATAPTFSVPDSYTLLIEPQRWYAPADGNTPVWVEITLLNGAGDPVPGSAVFLESSIGTVVDGGITDINGKTRAILRSAVAGEAIIHARAGVANDQNCTYARSAETTVTFEAAAQDNSLLAQARAPYLNDGIEISPMPVTRGVPTTIRATLTNPNPYPIKVEATIGYAQSGIGLTFGPIAQPQTKTISANGSATFEVVWTPAVSGHYCVQVSFTIVEGARAGDVSGGSGQRNLQVYGGSMITPSGKNSLQQAKVSNTAIDDANFIVGLITGPANTVVGFLQGQMLGNILDLIYETSGGIDCNMKGGTNCSGYQGPRLETPLGTLGNLAQDPPSQDYRRIVTIEPLEFPPITAGTNMPAARAQALNELGEVSVRTLESMYLANSAYDRYAGAAQASDLVWASLQSITYLQHLHDTATGLQQIADELENLMDVLEAEGIDDVFITEAGFKSYQNRLSSQGWNQTELQAAYLVGLNDDAMEARRQRILAKDPAQVAGSVLDDWQYLADMYRNVGRELLATPGLAGLSTDPDRGASLSGDNSPNLVQLYDVTAEIQVGNPLAEAATIDLRWRPVNIPPDWTVDIYPRQVNLQPGEEATVQVVVRPGSHTAQGQSATIAVEGFAANELLGGVAVEVNAPQETVPRYLYLPSVLR